ncbi:pyridoxal phosphate-dependent aminotransferase [Micromonospora sp. STR1s_6]|uniref:Aminotransferase n=1 Tax=Micromonospora tarensis TaxID=2806100 RepID=A0ABS1YB26_9ACTN|nr:pyridoxal phosphate-dependent aminotransferase [Micromonospora tarensis]
MSERASQLQGSSLAELLVLARDRNAINLAVGTPSFPDTPQVLIEEAISALRSGYNQYEAPVGAASLRKEIAKSLNTPPDPETEVTVTVGGTEALCIALLGSVDPGDEVIVLEPFYENFVSAIALAGAIPRFVRLRPPTWDFDPAELAAAFGPRTRAILLNTPSNPTGRMLSLDELNEIADLAERWDVTVISDEVYSHLVFDNRVHLSVSDVPRLRERGVVIGSLSKSLAVSGWRLGYLRAAADRTAVFRRLHEVTTSGTAAPLQLAAGRAGVVAGEWWRPAGELAVRRDLAIDIFTGLGLEIRPPDGGCFLFGDISRVTDENCNQFVARLLEENAVLLVPAAPFFADAERGRQFVRIAFNRSIETLEAARQNLSGLARKS